MPYKKSFHFSPGQAVPKDSKRSCYDPAKNTYTREACSRKYLIGQGVGPVYGGPDINPLTADSWGSGFFADSFGGV